jgi:hypothetical protein
MTFDCKDLERALAVPELLPDAREHAKSCSACRRELWLWGELSTVAPGLREDWETPDLWPKIRQSLVAQQKADKPRKVLWLDWRLMAGVAAAMVLAVSIAIVVYMQRAPAPAVAQRDSDFLTEQTLKEVESAEAAYRASIDKLTRLAQPRLTASESPEAMAAREKLLVLDSEIDNMRSTVNRNLFNAELQTELAALYREKQDALKELLQHAQ